MEKFDLNIEKVLENWEIYHAIREIIANALDEQKITGTQPIEIYKSDDGVWHIRDYGRGLHYKHFTQNESEEKQQHSGLIGKFGVGLKDALAVFDRKGIPVVIHSSQGIIRTQKHRKAGFEDIQTLHAIIEDRTDSFVGTDFQIYDCPDEEVEKAMSLFLEYSNLPLVEKTRYGEVYQKRKQVAEIFINGTKVAEEPNFMFSYNITNLTATIKKALNRERTNVGRSAYTDRIKDILLSTTGQEAISRIITAINESNCGQIPPEELKWVDIEVYAIKKLSEAKKLLIVTQFEMAMISGNDRDIIAHNDRQIIYASLQAKQKLVALKDPNIACLEYALQEYQDNFVYTFIDHSELSEQEQKTLLLYQWVRNILIICVNYKYFPVVKIAEELGNSAAGLWSPTEKAIIIKRCELNDTASFLGTLIHELVHANTRLDDVDREFEAELSNLIGIFAAKALGDNESI